MADRQFLRLNEKWALAYDSLQWIIQYCDSAKGTPESWRGVSFISSNRDILILTLKEKGIVPDLGKMDQVLSLPYTFKEWITQRQARKNVAARLTGSDKATQTIPSRQKDVPHSAIRGWSIPEHRAGLSRAPAGSFGKKPLVAIPRDLIAATLLERAYEPEDGEDLLAIPPSLDRKAEVPPNHPLRMCRKAKAKAA